MNVAFFKKALKAKGLTQEQFAEAVGIGYATLKKYFNGKSSPTIEIYKKMCDVLGVDMRYALDGGSDYPYQWRSDYRGVYGLLKELGYEISCNPNNEDEICIETMGLELYTTIQDLTDKIDNFIKFEVYRLANNKED